MPSGRNKPYTSVQIKEGVWYRAGGYTHNECCDCALVHREEFKIERGVLYWRAHRDDKRTEARRRELGIKVTRSK